MPRKGYRKPAHEARTIPVNVRLTPQEKNHLDTCVEASSVYGTADYLRHLIMGVEIKPRRISQSARLVDELARLNRKLASIDNNMNQLAHRANSSGIISEDEILRALGEQRDVRTLPADILTQIAGRR